ncbi:hypothetical protein HF325_002703 [Metschnikowia pulcherrima]|uniref:Dolichol phosphate-mannose biosynthesis regulatory protein n=1 Tax=Metschnikowia pulcherrima TaxID=27326 RepID=A0A8H7GXC9_9ASCO|nr:hypothetical protein HF325_002703 [Metschnikowia pulcherrima]
MLGVATAVFSYYTAWVFLVPFLDTDSMLQSFFLPRDYAIKLPILLLLLAALAVGTFIGNVMIKNAEKEKLKKSKKAD